MAMEDMDMEEVVMVKDDISHMDLQSTAHAPPEECRGLRHTWLKKAMMICQTKAHRA